MKTVDFGRACAIFSATEIGGIIRGHGRSHGLRVGGGNSRQRFQRRVHVDQEKSYWVIYNISANATKLAKNSKTVGKLGLNDKRRAEYEPMCSKGPGVKEYHITVFALSAEPKLSPDKANRA